MQETRVLHRDTALELAVSLMLDDEAVVKWHAK